MRNLLFRAALLAALCPAAPALAQAPLPPEESPVDVVQMGADRHTRMTVPVQVAGSGPYRFVVDTGAERTVISRELAGQLGLDAAGTVTMHSMSGISPVETVLIPDLGISKASVKNIRAPALGSFDLGAAGMLGVDSLQQQRILIDFKADTMTIQSARQRDPGRDADEIVVTARSRFGQLVLVDASVGRDPVQVIIDTGAQVSVGNEALRRAVAGRRSRLSFIPINLISVTGGSVQALFAQIPKIRIGGIFLSDLPVAFIDAQPFRALDLLDKPALLLGMDALRLFQRVSVDFANRKVRFLMREDAARGADHRLASLPSAPAPGS